MKSLVFEYADMLKRMTQLTSWADTLVRPICLWLPGLFNPTAYLTAVQQVTGRIEGWALDKMSTETMVTTMLGPNMVQEAPENGVLVHGLFLEGARWPTGDELEETRVEGGVTVGGYLVDGRLKELLPAMPVIYVRAVQVQSTWEPSAVGYYTSFRGPTYVFLATL